MTDYLSNLNKSLKRMSNSQNQLASGKNIQRPSDDPFGTIKAMNLDTSLKQNEQYKRNIEDSLDFLNVTDASLGTMTDALQRIRELTLYGMNGTMSDKDMQNVSKEIDQNVSQLVEAGNTFFGGKYIFSGQNTDQIPFELSGSKIVYLSGDSGKLSREISKSVTVDVNTTGTEIMNSGGSLSTTLDELSNAMKNGDKAALKDMLIKIDVEVDNLLNQRAIAGAKYNRLDAAKLKNETETVNLTEMFSRTVDVDFAQKLMEYSMMNSAYQASLQTGAKILQPSLLNYL